MAVVGCLWAGACTLAIAVPAPAVTTGPAAARAVRAPGQAPVAGRGPHV
jgi:hypothetical protein